MLRFLYYYCEILLNRKISIVITFYVIKYVSNYRKQDDVSDDEVVRIRGSYLADLTRAPQNSDFDSDTSDEDSVRGWFWQQPKTSNKHDEEVVTNDSDIMTSSSEGEVEGDSSSLGWCNIL